MNGRIRSHWSTSSAPRKFNLPNIVGLGVFLVMSSWASVTSAQTQESIAQVWFEEGIALYERQEFLGALQAFRTSLSLIPSPNSRLYVARCLRELDRIAESISEYHLTEREASDRALHDPRYHPTREAAETEREALADRVGWLTLHIDSPPPDIVVHLSGREIPRQAIDLPIPVDPGHIEIDIEAQGRLPLHREVTIVAGERGVLELELSLIPSEEPRPPRSTRRRGMMAGTFTNLGLAIASIVVFGALYALADDQFQELEDVCGGTCSSENADWVESAIDRGEALQLGVNLSIGLSSSFAAAATILAILTPWRDRAQQTSRVSTFSSW